MNNELKIATILSKLFEPALLLSLSFVAVAVRFGVPFAQSLLWLFVLIGPVIAYRVWAKYRMGLDWDIHDRTKRIKPMGVLVGYLCIAGVILYRFEPRIVPIQVLFLVWTVGFLCITRYWTKISGHVGGDTLAVGMMILWYGWGFWPLLGIIPLVAWSRVVRKDHTIFQVILGAVYSWSLLLLVYKFSIFNY